MGESHSVVRRQTTLRQYPNRVHDKKEKTMFYTDLTAVSLRQSPLFRIAQSALLTLGGIAAIAIQAQAANVSSTSSSSLNSSSGTAPIATTSVHGYVGSSVEDPLGAKSASTFRTWNGVDVNLTSGNQYSHVYVT